MTTLTWNWFSRLDPIVAEYADLLAYRDLYSEPDHLHGSIVAPVNHFAQAMELGASMLARPRLESRWFDRLQGDLKAEIAEQSKESSERVLDLARRLILGNQSLERYLSLEPASLVDNATLDDVLHWHHQTLKRAGTTVAVAGAIDLATAGKAVDTLLAGLPKGIATKPEKRPAADFSPRTVQLQDPRVGKSTVALMGRLPPASEGHELEDAVIEQILGGSERSRLFEAIRTGLRASYTIGAEVVYPTRELGGVMLAEITTSKLATARPLMRVDRPEIQSGHTDRSQPGDPASTTQEDRRRYVHADDSSDPLYPLTTVD